MASITNHEAQQVNEANSLGRTPVVFVHGLWLLPSSWDRAVPWTIANASYQRQRSEMRA